MLVINQELNSSWNSSPTLKSYLLLGFIPKMVPFSFYTLQLTIENSNLLGGGTFAYCQGLLQNHSCVIPSMPSQTNTMNVHFSLNQCFFSTNLSFFFTQTFRNFGFFFLMYFTNFAILLENFAFFFIVVCLQSPFPTFSQVFSHLEDLIVIEHQSSHSRSLIFIQSQNFRSLLLINNDMSHGKFLNLEDLQTLNLMRFNVVIDL